MIGPNHSCDREEDVLDLVAIGAWPVRADEALKQHVASCDTCRSLVTVVIALAEHGSLPVTPRLPDARLVWHRAQMRARQDAARRAARPVVMAEIMAVAVFVVLVFTWTTGAAFPIDRMKSMVSMVAAGLAAAGRDLPTAWQGASALVQDQGQTLAALGRPLVMAALAGIALLLAAFGLSFLADRSERT